MSRADNRSSHPRRRRYPLKGESAGKGTFPHFMLKEIHEQPEKSANLLAFLGESGGLARVARAVKEAPRLYLVGSGTSYNACLVGSYYLSKLAGIPGVPVPAGAFIQQVGVALREGDVVLCVSQSGETKDLVDVVGYCEEVGKGRVLSFVNAPVSTLGRHSKLYLPVDSDLEISVPATKTFTNQILLFAAVADAAAGGGKVDLGAVPGLLRATLAAVEPKVRGLAKELVGREEFYCLGCGITHGIALEGALKIKESTYVHCEGMYSSEFKHGPLAIVSPGYPIIFVSTAEDAGATNSPVNEVNSCGARAITIAPPHPLLERNSRDYVPLPTEDFYLVPFAATVPLQLLAYHMSIGRGIDPDFPRNISKTQTVD